MAEIMGTDYTKRKKDVLNIVIGTEEDPVELSLFGPTKGIYEGLLEVSKTVDDALAGKLDEEFNLFDQLDFVARAMSHNKQGRRVTADDLVEMDFDMSDVADFIGLYLFFIDKLAQGKN